MAFGDLKSGSLTFTGNAASITNPFSATGSIAVNVGDLIFAVLGQQTALTVTACGDNLHGSSTYAAPNAGTDSGGSSGRAFYKRVTVAGTLTSVDFVTTASANNVTAVAAAFEGPFDSSPLDANPANNTDATSSFTCPATGTLSQASELVVCWGAAPDNTVWAATSPNLLGPQVASAALVHCLIGYQTVNATTTISPAFTAGANPTDAALGTNSFKQDLNIQIFQNTQVLSKLITYKRKSLPRHKNENDLGGFDPSETARVRSLFFLGRSFNVPRTQNRNFNVNGQTIFDQDLAPALFDDSLTDTFYTPIVNQEYPSVGFIPPPRKPSRHYRLPQSVGSSFIDTSEARAPFFIHRTFSKPRTHNRDFSVPVASTPPGDQNLTPTLYDDSTTDTFYTPTVNQEYPAVGFTPPVRDPPLRSRVPRRVSVSTPFSTVDFNLSPSLYVDDDTFYTPVVEQDTEIVTRDPTPLHRLRRRIVRNDFSVGLPFDSLTQDLTSNLYTNDSTFYTPTVTLQEIPAQNVIDRRIHRQPVRLHNVSVSSPITDFDLSPSLYIDDDTFYEPTVVSQGQLFPDIYENVNTFYTPIITISDVSARQPYFVRRYEPRRPRSKINVNQSQGDFGSVDLTPNLFTNDNTFYTPTVTQLGFSNYSVTLAVGRVQSRRRHLSQNTPLSTVEQELFIYDIPLPSRHRVYPRHRDFTQTGNDSLTRQDLFPSLFVDDDTFYTPIVAVGAVDLTPSLYTNDNVFYSPIVNAAGNISPSYYVNDNTFYVPVVFADIPGQTFYPSIRIVRLHRRFANHSTPVSTLSNDLAPSLYTNTNTFYSPTIVGGAINLQPSLYVDDDTFYTPIITTGTVNLDSSLYTNTSVFYTPVVTIANPLTPSLYTNTNTFYAPTITTTYNITPPLYTNTNIHYESFLSGGDKPLFLSLYVNTSVIYSPLVVGPGQEIEPTIFGGIIGQPPTLVERRSIVVEGIILTFTIRIIPGRARTVSFFPGRVEIDVVPILKPLRDVEATFSILGGAIGNDIFEDNMDDLLLIISEMLLE